MSSAIVVFAVFLLIFLLVGRILMGRDAVVVSWYTAKGAHRSLLPGKSTPFHPFLARPSPFIIGIIGRSLSNLQFDISDLSERKRRNQPLGPNRVVTSRETVCGTFRGKGCGVQQKGYSKHARSHTIWSFCHSGCAVSGSVSMARVSGWLWCFVVVSGCASRPVASPGPMPTVQSLQPNSAKRFDMSGRTCARGQEGAVMEEEPHIQPGVWGEGKPGKSCGCLR